MKAKSPISMLKKGLLISPFRKKLLSLFILAAMLVNGFAMSAGEASETGKYSIMLVVAAVTQNAIMQVVNQWNESLIEVSKGISGYFGSLFKMDSGNFSGTKKEQKKEESGNGAATSGKAVIKELRKDEDENKVMKLNAGVNVKKLFQLYKKRKVPDDPGGGGIVLLFIMFIVGIRQRKGLGEIAAIAVLNNKIRKIKISVREAIVPGFLFFQINVRTASRAVSAVILREVAESMNLLTLRLRTKRFSAATAGYIQIINEEGGYWREKENKSKEDIIELKSKFRNVLAVVLKQKGKNLEK